MRKFVCSMSYELHHETGDEARRLVRAELVGRRWLDRVEDRKLPANAVFMVRSAADDETTDDVHGACARDLRAAAEAVRRTGRPIVVVRAWVHVSGSGTYGPVAGELASPEG
jgi:hypothetical protein